jgi:hypothetical protein
MARSRPASRIEPITLLGSQSAPVADAGRPARHRTIMAEQG